MSPPQIIRDLDETADLLEDALAVLNNGSHPAWDALQAHYTSDFFVSHGASVNYYLAEADCI